MLEGQCWGAREEKNKKTGWRARRRKGLERNKEKRQNKREGVLGRVSMGIRNGKFFSFSQLGWEATVINSRGTHWTVMHLVYIMRRRGSFLLFLVFLASPRFLSLACWTKAEQHFLLLLMTELQLPLTHTPCIYNSDRYQTPKIDYTLAVYWRSCVLRDSIFWLLCSCCLSSESWDVNIVVHKQTWSVRFNV